MTDRSSCRVATVVGAEDRVSVVVDADRREVVLVEERRAASSEEWSRIGSVSFSVDDADMIVVGVVKAIQRLRA
jgi:hypothetical protein